MIAPAKTTFAMPKQIGDFAPIAAMLDEEDCRVLAISGFTMAQLNPFADNSIDIDLPTISAKIKRTSAVYARMSASRVFSVQIDSRRLGQNALLDCEVADFIETRSFGFFIGEVFALQITPTEKPSIHHLNIAAYA